MTVEGIPPCTSVLYLTASAEIGGGNRSLVALWAGLRKTAGVRVMVVCPSDGPMVGLCRELGMCCEVHEYQQTSWRQPLGSWRGWRSWCDVLGRARADLVHANSLDGARSICLAARLSGRPLVCHIRFPSKVDYIDWAFRGLPKPQAFVFNSRAVQHETGQHLARACPRSEQHVIYNAVDLEVFQPQPKAAGPPSRVGIIANLAPIKGHDDFLEMARRLLDKGCACEFWMIGEDITHSGYGDYLARRAAELGVSRGVRFLGFRHDLPRLLNELDIVVSSSQYESFPRCLLEAMACGRPVVATAVGGVSELVEDGKTGVLVRPHDPEALAAAVERLVDDGHAREEIGRAGRAHVEALFGLDAHAGRIATVYAHMLSRTRVKAGHGARASWHL